MAFKLGQSAFSLRVAVELPEKIRPVAIFYGCGLDSDIDTWTRVRPTPSYKLRTSRKRLRALENRYDFLLVINETIQRRCFTPISSSRVWLWDCASREVRVSLGDSRSVCCTILLTLAFSSTPGCDTTLSSKHTLQRRSKTPTLIKTLY